MYRFILLCVIHLISIPSYAQHTCATEIILEKQLQNPEYEIRHKQMETSIYQNLQNHNLQKKSEEEIYTIPIVIHIMHLGEEIGKGSNLSDEDIEIGFGYLNEAFRNQGIYSEDPMYTNADISSEDIKIEFCLAIQDPNGNPTNGINRVKTPLSNLYIAEKCEDGTTNSTCLKALSTWNTNDYLNIWLVNEICESPGNNCGIGGFSTLASAHGYPIDGIVVESKFWSSSPHKAKVNIHEIGHYLNLYHTFKGGCSETNCLTEGDLVCDTPPENSIKATNCILGGTSNTCHNDADITNTVFTTDIDDMYENYMDYGLQQCQNTFTNGQKTRMRNSLTFVRTSLLNSKGCQEVETIPSANFTSNYESVCLNTAINFKEKSIGKVDSWYWEFPGGIPSTSTEESPSIVYPNKGSFNVSLTVTNQYGEDSFTKVDAIKVGSYDKKYTPSTSNIGTEVNYRLGITNVTLGEINNNTFTTYASKSSYEDFSCSQDITTTLAEFNEYMISISAGFYVKPETVKAWIDFNGNTILEEDELIFHTNEAIGAPITSYFTVPNLNMVNQRQSDNNNNNKVLLRVISDQSDQIISPNSTPIYGQVEDYLVTINNERSLPLIWQSFDVMPMNNHITLNWSTTEEVSTNFFEIQKRNSNGLFKTIGTVDNKNTLGNHSYHFSDYELTNDGDYYYRIKQVDINGAFSLSEVKHVIYHPKEELKIYPNPSHGEFSIKGIDTSNIKSINVISSFGKKLMEITNIDKNTIDLSHLDNGMYYISIETLSAKKLTHKVIKL